MWEPLRALRIEDIVVGEERTSSGPHSLKFSSEGLEGVYWLGQTVNVPYSPKRLEMQVNGVRFCYPVDGNIEIQERGHRRHSPLYVDPNDSKTLNLLMVAARRRHGNTKYSQGESITDYYNQVKALHLKGTINKA